QGATKRPAGRRRPRPADAPRRAFHPEVAMLRRPFSLWLVCLALTTAGAGVGALPRAAPSGETGTAPARVPSFREVGPLLQARCWRCHGDKARRADLDLRTPAGI